MKRLLAACLLCFSVSALAGNAFSYDQQLAIDLSKAYLSSYIRNNNETGFMSKLDKPQFSSAVAANGRKLVLVSYAITGNSSGAYVELELCSENKLLTVVDVGEVNPLNAYRAETGRINSKVYVAVPAVCPLEVP